MTELLPYWPTEEEINNCIKTEAESASDAVLLSVHQETPLSIRNAGSDTKSTVTEDDLLNDFLSPNLPEGTKVLAITGVSGAGKSHMIRWLAAHLERDPRAANMHVIRIPKSANLKRVVELILEPLSGDKRFERIRKDLEEAVSSVTPEYAAIHFLANLEVALQEKANILDGMIREEDNREEKRALKSQLHHAKNLPGYFNDAALTAHFKGKVLSNIVARAIVGKSETEDDKFPQFSIEDLKLPDDNNIGEAATAVQIYYQTTLQKGEDGDGYKLAVEVLNSVVDKAIQNLFRLNQAMGGVTLEDIVNQIRVLLMEEGKELVLLIEDFAALSGIQEVLLSVIIQEAEYDGKQIKSPMRTALAVTDGYLGNRSTILERAKREWIVESTLPRDEDVIDRTERLVAAYLNAARWGEAELIRRFEQSRKDQKASLTDWIEVYRNDNETDKEANLLKAFGSEREIPLFPYNRNAIKKLIEENLRAGGALEFRPRRVINHIIRDPLLLRKEFEAGAFPPENFSEHATKTAIATWVSSLRLDRVIDSRLKQLLIFWGGDPDNPDNLGSISAGVFEAFNLPTVSGLGAPPPPSDPPPKREEPDPGLPPKRKDPNPEPPVVRDDFIERWDKTLNSWVAGQRLTQDEANDIRSSIISVLREAIDWNAACMARVDLPQTYIEIPNARGNPRTDKKIVFSEKTKDEDGHLRRTLLAFLRYEKHGGKWDYPEADKDTALIANALDRLIPEYLNIVVKKASEDASILAAALVRQGQVLGVAPKRIAGRPSIVDAIFSPAPAIENSSYPPASPEKRWFDLKVEAATERKALQDLLATKIGAFQGAGNTVYAIDIARLNLSDAEPLPRPDGLNEEQRDHFTNLSKSRLKARSKDLARNLSDLTKLIKSALGEGFDNQNIVKEVRTLAELAEEANVWPSQFDLEKPTFFEELDRFQDAPVSDAVEKLENISDAVSADNLDETIHALGRINIAETNEINKLITLLNLFMEGIEAEINYREQGDTGMSIADLISEHKSVFRELKSTFSISNGA